MQEDMCDKRHVRLCKSNTATIDEGAWESKQVVCCDFKFSFAWRKALTPNHHISLWNCMSQAGISAQGSNANALSCPRATSCSLFPFFWDKRNHSVFNWFLAIAPVCSSLIFLIFCSWALAPFCSCSWTIWWFTMTPSANWEIVNNCSCLLLLLMSNCSSSTKPKNCKKAASSQKALPCTFSHKFECHMIRNMTNQWHNELLFRAQKMPQKMMWFWACAINDLQEAATNEVCKLADGTQCGVLSELFPLDGRRPRKFARYARVVFPVATMVRYEAPTAISRPI